MVERYVIGRIGTMASALLTGTEAEALDGRLADRVNQCVKWHRLTPISMHFVKGVVYVVMMPAPSLN